MSFAMNLKTKYRPNSYLVLPFFVLNSKNKDGFLSLPSNIVFRKTDEISMSANIHAIPVGS